MRYFVVILIAVALIFFATSFGFGSGYAGSGGTLELFSDDISASSNSGQAIAIGDGNNVEITANNTPVPLHTSAPKSENILAIATLVFVCVIVGVTKMFLSTKEKEWEYADNRDAYADQDWQPPYEKQPDGTKNRNYGNE